MIEELETFTISSAREQLWTAVRGRFSSPQGIRLLSAPLRDKILRLRRNHRR
jgi:hypothetical protein